VIHTFTATILGDMGPHKWDMVRVPSSTEMLGTGKAVKIRFSKSSLNDLRPPPKPVTA
jgi:hypothetical protein